MILTGLRFVWIDSTIGRRMSVYRYKAFVRRTVGSVILLSLADFFQSYVYTYSQFSLPSPSARRKIRIVEKKGKNRKERKRYRIFVNVPINVNDRPPLTHSLIFTKSRTYTYK